MLRGMWQNAEVATPTKMRLEEFIGWFENRIVEIFAEELKSLHLAMLTVEECIDALKAISQNARKVSASNSIPITNRMIKILDQLDSIPDMFVGGRRFYFDQPQYSFLSASQLPDLFFVCDFVLNVKNKLKAIDDVVSSKTGKFIKAQTGNQKKTLDPLRIRSEIKRTAAALDILEAGAVEKLLVMNHFSDLKAKIHQPVNEMIVAFSCLPSMSDYKAVVDIEFGALKKCEEAYLKARSEVCLANAAKLKNESLFIELCVAEMLHVLQPLAQTPTSDKVLSFVLHASGNSDISWYQDLISLTVLPVNELLLHCVNQKQNHPFHVDMTNLQQLCASAAASNSSELAEVPSGLLESIMNFDSELFVAYTEDWNERNIVLSKYCLLLFRCLCFSLYFVKISYSCSREN